MKILFFSDTPPLASGGHGNHGIAGNLIRSLRDNLSMVATRRARRSISRNTIEEACRGIPLFLAMDASLLGIRRFLPRIATFIDLLLLALSLPILTHRARLLGVERIIFLCGADASWLFAVKLLQLTGLPLDLYVVDDLERFAVINKHLLRRFTPALFGHVARHCRKVYAISQGYADQIKRDHGIDAIWLPVPIAEKPYIPEPYLPCTAKVRSIVYSGAINHLYKDAITDLYHEIIRHNESPGRTYDLHLILMSYGDPCHFTKTLPHEKFVTGYQQLPEEERITLLRSGYACFLPYSFEEEERTMVTTSFSCKIIEYYKSGRPIIVYGPAYASIPRYFIDNELPLVSTRRNNLAEVLVQVANHDSRKTINDYYNSWKLQHTPEALIRVLQL